MKQFLEKRQIQLFIGAQCVSWKGWLCRSGRLLLSTVLDWSQLSAARQRSRWLRFIFFRELLCCFYFFSSSKKSWNEKLNLFFKTNFCFYSNVCQRWRQSIDERDCVLRRRRQSESSIDVSRWHVRFQRRVGVHSRLAGQVGRRWWECCHVLVLQFLNDMCSYFQFN